jgi:hypothetical protein
LILCANATTPKVYAKCETKGLVVITREGKAGAVLPAPLDHDDLERLLLSRSPRFQALLDKSRRSIRGAGQGLSGNDFWKAVGRRRQNSASPKP